MAKLKLNGQNIFIAIVVIAILLFLAISYANADVKTTPHCVGCDRDIHGCIGSAGYSWCEAKEKCLRIWEENCTTSTASPT